MALPVAIFQTIISYLTFNPDSFYNEQNNTHTRLRPTSGHFG